VLFARVGAGADNLMIVSLVVPSFPRKRESSLLCFMVVRPLGGCRCKNQSLWVVDPRQVTFSCLPKRKSPKRRAPRSLRPHENHVRVPCAPRQPRARDELAEREKRALRARTSSREVPRCWLRCSACSTGALTATTHDPRHGVGFFFCRAPYGAWLSIAERWGEPVRIAARKAATESQHKEVL